MKTTNARFFRALAGCVGIAALVLVGLLVYVSFSPFTPWTLAIAVLVSPVAAKSLWFAFHGAPRSGGSGFASASVTWPRPSGPPVRSAAAAQAIPVAPVPFEYLPPPDLDADR
jgi:cobalamin synthase